MLPWTRPDPHTEFEADARALLAAFREAVADGKTHSEAFESRKIWSGTWKRRQQQAGLHKKKLAGPLRWTTKCVWCERLRDLSRELDVEHYRPKGGLSEWQGNPAPVSDTPPPEKHLNPAAYWWLAFSWHNFTLACKTCNQGWKRNLFPVEAPRSPCVEGVERHEKPLLLDPASSCFRARDHFRWEVLSGIIEGVSPQGRATIITCGLNRRELLDRRAKIAHETYSTSERFVRANRREDWASVDKASERLVELASITAEFTSMTRWIIEETTALTWHELENISSNS